MLGKMFFTILFVSCLVFESNASHGIGPINNPCLRGDINCISAVNIRAAFPCLADGIPDLGIRGLEPMNFKNVTSDQGFFKLVFPAMRVFGTRQCKVVASNTDVLENTISVTQDCPLEAIGKYLLTAKSYVFDISNEGNFALQSDSIRTTIKSRYETIYGTDGKQYMNLIDYEYVYEPIEKFHIELGNLFSGDIERGQFFLNFVPNGWLISMAKIGEPVVNGIVESFFEVFKAALLRLPLN